MRNTIVLALFLPALILGQTGEHDSCPGCDLPLKGFTLGGFFGVGTFSVDADSPTVAGTIDSDEMPGWSYRAGGGVYLYPGGKFRFGLIGGANWTGVSGNSGSIDAIALWGAVSPEIVRTTGSVRITAGMGIGGGIASVKVEEPGTPGAEGDEMFFLLCPKAGIDLPFGKNVILNVELSYLWFMGNDKVLKWSGPGDGDAERETRFSPVEFGGPSVSAGIYFGCVKELPRK